MTAKNRQEAEAFWHELQNKWVAEEAAHKATKLVDKYAARVSKQRAIKHERKFHHVVAEMLLRPMSSGRNAPTMIRPFSFPETMRKLLSLGQPCTKPARIQSTPYMPPDHPDRRGMVAKAQAETDVGHEPVYQRGDRSKVVLPPPVEYTKPTMIRRRKVGNEAKFLYGFFPSTASAPVQWEYQPPQLWMPDDLAENETSSSSGDPLVILLEREGAYQEANELRQAHRAGTTQGVLKFYMEQRPDRYPQTLPGTVWVSQANGNATEVKPYIRARRVKAA